MDEQENKKAILTGGTAGIGKETVLELARKGYQVITLGRDREKIEALLEQAENEGLKDKISVHQMDLADTENLPDFVDRLWSEDGPFQVLINNAGIGFSSVLDSTARDIEYLLKTNVNSYMLFAAKIGGKMVDENIQGDIINIGSMSALTRGKGSSGYVATKCAIEGFSEALRKEVNPHNIRVILIQPGAVGTDMQEMPVHEQHELQQKLEMLTVGDIVSTIVFALDMPRRANITSLSIKPLRQFI